MAIKKAIYQIDNGANFDEIHFKTSAEQVYMPDGSDVKTSILSLQNELSTNKSTLQNNINAIREVL